MKRTPVYILSFSAAALIFSLIVWSLFQHGTGGFLRVTRPFVYAFVLVGLLAISLLFLTWLYRRMTGAAAAKSVRGFSLCLGGLSVAFLLVFAWLWLALAGVPSAGRINHVPQLQLDQSDPQTLHFAVGSDAHFGAGNNDLTATREMLAQIADPANKYNLFLFLGDLVEYGFLDSQWKEAVQAFSPVASAVPVRFAAGNHDTLFAGLGHYLQYCAPSATANFSDTRLWYRLDAGIVHFLVLDVEWSAESFTAAQAAWLETQLSSIPKTDWKIVLSHGFYYASGINSEGWKWYDNTETISRITPLFEKYRVDLVFSGHDHDLELLQHNGVRYAICGGFGGMPDRIRTYTSPASLWYQGEMHGFADVSIEGDQATLVFRDPGDRPIKGVTFQKGS